MKNIFILLALILSTNLYAEDFLSNQDCITTYRESYINLKRFTDEFNEGNIDQFDFSALVTGLSINTAGKRGLCMIVEDPYVHECVLSYKKLYKKLRNRIKVTSVLSGNQTTIHYSESLAELNDENMNSSDDYEESFFGRLKGFITEGLAMSEESYQETKQKTLLALVDDRCLQ